MRIAILGGGITGMAAAYYLSKKGHMITLFEKEKALGGLAVGFKAEGWEWPLERAYHHLFASDKEMLGFAQEIGFDKIFFNEPITASLYKNEKLETYKLDSPIDLFKFPLLNFVQKLRAAATLGFFKLSPFLSIYEKQTAESFLKKTMGERGWNILFGELFRKKFGKYAGNILTSFIWARVKVRTQKLGYIKGGFQTFTEYVEKQLGKEGVKIKKDYEIKSIEKTPRNKFIIDGEEFDVVISTLPTVILKKIAKDVLPENFLSKFDNLHYLHAVCLIVESDMPLLEKEYWLSVYVPEIPIMVLVQHTNMIDKKHYGGKHILYIGNYVERDDKLMEMDKDELMKYFLPHLKKINTKYKILNTKYYSFKGPFAQPIFDKTFLQNMPTFKTPVENFYIANLDMTYPQDRGTNYAVKLGREMSERITSEDLSGSLSTKVREKDYKKARREAGKFLASKYKLK